MRLKNNETTCFFGKKIMKEQDHSRRDNETCQEREVCLANQSKLAPQRHRETNVKIGHCLAGQIMKNGSKSDQ